MVVKEVIVKEVNFYKNCQDIINFQVFRERLGNNMALAGAGDDPYGVPRRGDRRRHSTNSSLSSGRSVPLAAMMLLPISHSMQPMFFLRKSGNLRHHLVIYVTEEIGMISGLPPTLEASFLAITLYI